MMDGKITWREMRGKVTKTVDVNYPGLKEYSFMSQRQKCLEIKDLHLYMD